MAEEIKTKTIGELDESSEALSASDEFIISKLINGVKATKKTTLQKIKDFLGIDELNTKLDETSTYLSEKIIVKSGIIATAGTTYGEVITDTFETPFPSGYTLIPVVWHGVTSNTAYADIGIGVYVSTTGISITLVKTSSSSPTPTLNYGVIGIKN